MDNRNSTDTYREDDESFQQQLELTRAAHRARYALLRRKEDDSREVALESQQSTEPPLKRRTTRSRSTPENERQQEHTSEEPGRLDEQLARSLQAEERGRATASPAASAWFSGKHVLRNRLGNSQSSVVPSSWLLSLENLVQAVDITTYSRIKLLNAVFTAGGIDRKWVLDACDDPGLGFTQPVTFVSDAKWEDRTAVAVTGRSVEIVLKYPNQEHRLWHAKVMLLRFEDRLRVVVTSANFCKAEFETQTQNFYCQDFPPRSSQEQQRSEVGRDYYDNLDRFVTSTEMAQPQCPWLADYDYDNAKVRLCLSVPGSFPSQPPGILGGEVQFGWLRLRQILSQVCSTHCTAQAPSIGALTWQWLRAFLRESNVSGLPADDSDLHKSVAIAYPSRWRQSRKKTKIHLLTKEKYDNPEFPRTVFRDLVPINTRPEYDFHTKVIVWRTQDHDGQQAETTAVYAGSHSFSIAAWGKFGTGTCVINNAEAGVVFIGEEARNVAHNLHFVIPPPEYEEGDSPHTR